MTASATRPDEHLNHPWRQAVTREEIRALLEMQDLRTWGSIGINWGIIAASLAAVAAWPHLLTILAAVFLIGARQLGLAVLMHEASHRSLLSDRRLNDLVGNWLCAYPIWSDLFPYRPYHIQHHARTGSPEDPDIGLVRPFPITRKSLARKAWRDLSGQTGWKFARAAWRRSFGAYSEDAGARKATRGFVITNAILLGLLAVLGHPALYLVWVVAWFTTYTLVTRIRSIAEHALTPRAEDPLGNTRTTIARWWERLLVAPNRVNYHLEHHLLMTVPHYRLPRMHQLLRERGILDDACVATGYLGILRNACSRTTEGDAPGDDSAPEELSRVNGLS